MNLIEDLLRDVDDRWDRRADESRISLKIIGSSALHLRTNYRRATKDGDILETEQVNPDIKSRIVALAGVHTSLHMRHSMYLEVVGRAVPLLPPDPLWHPHAIALQNFDVFALDVADVLVSKLVRFIAPDRDDIRQMIEGGHVDHERMIQRLREVIDWYQFDARCDQLPKMVDRFHEVERDWFGVEETEIEIPETVFR